MHFEIFLNYYALCYIELVYTIFCIIFIINVWVQWELF